MLVLINNFFFFFFGVAGHRVCPDHPAVIAEQMEINSCIPIKSCLQKETSGLDYKGLWFTNTWCQYLTSHLTSRAVRDLEFPTPFLLSLLSASSLPTPVSC